MTSCGATSMLHLWICKWLSVFTFQTICARLYRSQNDMLKRRFHIGFGQEPTVMLFSKSRFYKYSKDSFTVEDMIHFVKNSYDRSHHQGRMPLIPTMWQEIEHFWNDEIHLKDGILMSVLFMDEETRSVNWIAVCCCYFMLPVILYCFYKVMGLQWDTSVDLSQELRQLELKNLETREKMRKWIETHSNYKKNVRKWE